MRDTRRFFDGLVERKPTSWDDLPVVTVTDERMKILMSLPRRIVSWDSTPMNNIFPGAKPGSSYGDSCEWVVVRLGEEDLQHFYVNNEGYTYSRYIFRFDPRVV